MLPGPGSPQGKARGRCTWALRLVLSQPHLTSVSLPLRSSERVMKGACFPEDSLSVSTQGGECYEFNCVPHQNSYVEALIPRPRHVWPYLEIGPLQMSLVKMRPLGWALIQYDRNPYKKGNFGFRHADREKPCDWGGTSASQSTPESAPKPLEAGGGLESTLPRSPQRDPALPMLGSQTSSLQNCRARNPCCRHHPFVVLCSACAGMVRK